MSLTTPKKKSAICHVRTKSNVAMRLMCDLVCQQVDRILYSLDMKLIDADVRYLILTYRLRDSHCVILVCG